MNVQFKSTVGTKKEVAMPSKREGQRILGEVAEGCNSASGEETFATKKKLVNY